MKRLAPALALAILLSGCVLPGTTVKSASTTQLAAPTLDLAEKSLVSIAGHRVSEFMVARSPVDPLRLLAGISSDYDRDSGTSGCAAALSTDGGKSWKAVKIPAFERSHNSFDAWASFDKDGVAHMICDETDDGAKVHVLYSRSADGGTTWSPGVMIKDRVDGMSTDKDALLAARDGTLYATFGEFNGDSANPGGLVVARSLDHGASWEKPRLLSTKGGAPNGLLESKNGTLLLLHETGENFAVAYSTDRADSWTTVEIGPTDRAPGYNDQNRWVEQRPWTALPAMAVSPMTDHVFVASQGWNQTTNLYEARLYRSDDVGQSYHRLALPTFPTYTCSPCHVTHPSIAVDDRGALALEVQLVNDGGTVKQVWIAGSRNEGASWSNPMQLSSTDLATSWATAKEWTPGPQVATGPAQHLAKDPTDAPTTAIGMGISAAVGELQFRWDGEYWMLGSSSDGIVAMWIDHSAGGTPQLYARPLAIDRK